MLINLLETQLQTFFYPGYSKRNVTSVQAPVLGKENLLADKSDNNVFYYILLFYSTILLVSSNEINLNIPQLNMIFTSNIPQLNMTFTSNIPQLNMTCTSNIPQLNMTFTS